MSMMQKISVQYPRLKHFAVKTAHEKLGFRLSSLNAGRSSFHSFTAGSHYYSNKSILACQSLIINDYMSSASIRKHHPFYDYLQQHSYSNSSIILGRKDGHSAFYKTRPPTKKQRKKYFKRKREQYHEKVGKHSKPGSVAGPMREYEALEKQDLIDKGAGRITRGLLEENAGYHYGDALLDDLMGNTASLTSAPTPKPLNIRKQYTKYYTLVSGLMNDYNAQLATLTNSGEEKEGDSNNNALSTPLPTDKEISLLVRSYHDKYSKKHKPVGIAKALQLLMSEIKVPTSLYGKRTYSALMYCAASPKEARRIMQMMEENGLPPGQYAYSILVDIYAKSGDFRGADDVLSEMKFESIEPTLAAYTSLLAACYKAISTASMPQSIKAEAGKLAWTRWKEMRINGLDPDVMAYGAIIRIMAARGLPEKAINFIEEMQVMNVKPTTLIFTAALRSVARSHARSLMFEGGFSKKEKRREAITLHHGKLTRQIVILAEQAQIKQDDGFTSALMLCAATAGDFATTKAIYLASEVRKLEHLRIIGGPEHLRLFHDVDGREGNELLGIESKLKNLAISDGDSQGEENKLVESQDRDSIETSRSERDQFQLVKNESRRKDTRTLSILLRASANAMEVGGLGNMWKGVENKGFLCENSLRLINARYQPKYVDQSIPGISGTESGLASMVWDDDEDARLMGKRLKRKKFRGLLEDTDDNRMEDLDPTLYKLFAEDEDILFGIKDDSDSGANESYEDSFQINTGSKDPSSPSSHKSNISPDVYEDAEYEETDYEEYKETEFKDVGFGEEADYYKAEMNVMEQRNDSTIVDEALIVSESLNHDIDTSTEGKSNNESIQHPIINATSDEVSLQAPSLDDNADELDLILHGMPKSRIRKVRDEFKAALGDPSMLRLVPLLRENLPAEITMEWLRKKNIQDAHAVFGKAKEDGIVDIHVLNSMLQVHAKSGKINDALSFYYEQYELQNIDPPATTDRTVFQMLINGHRISKALDFKDRIERKGKNLDLLSYGSLIEYLGNNNQIGSAIAMLKECKMIHGSPPGEHCLKQIRIKCRQQGLEAKLDLEKLIGKDPLYWIKKGENELKREYSKKGRRQVQHAANKLVHI